MYFLLVVGVEVFISQSVTGGDNITRVARPYHPLYHCPPGQGRPAWEPQTWLRALRATGGGEEGGRQGQSPCSSYRQRGGGAVWRTPWGPARPQQPGRWGSGRFPRHRRCSRLGTSRWSSSDPAGPPPSASSGVALSALQLFSQIRAGKERQGER